MKYYLKITIIILLIILLSPISTRALDLKGPISEYQKIKTKIPTLSSNQESPEYLAIKKEQLIKISSILVVSLSSDRDMIFTLQSIDQTQKNQLAVIIQTSVDKIVAQSSKIALAENLNDLKTISKLILDLWQSTHTLYKSSLAQMLNSEFDNITTDTASNIDAIKTESARLKSQNKDVTLLNSKVEEAESILSQIRVVISTNQQLVSGIDKNFNTNSTFEQFLQSLADSQKLVLKMQQSLSDAELEVNRYSTK
ncbi:MAG: hypothetical protein Q7S37_03485 [bacterium]|nr:hypothetical protein [bacterium]